MAQRNDQVAKAERPAAVASKSGHLFDNRPQCPDVFLASHQANDQIVFPVDLATKARVLCHTKEARMSRRET